MITAEPEHPVAKRMRERHEAKYGELSEVMRSIQNWRNVVEDFRGPFNRDREKPVTEEDVEAAELQMLADIRDYSKKSEGTNCVKN